MKACHPSRSLNTQFKLSEGYITGYTIHNIENSPIVKPEACVLRSVCNWTQFEAQKDASVLKENATFKTH